MKKINYLIFLLCSILIFTSCNSSNENKHQYQEKELLTLIENGLKQDSSYSHYEYSSASETYIFYFSNEYIGSYYECYYVDDECKQIIDDAEEYLNDLCKNVVNILRADNYDYSVWFQLDDGNDVLYFTSLNGTSNSIKDDLNKE